MATLPALIAVALVFVYPILQGIQISFSDWPGIGDIQVTGIGNYADVLTSPAFYSALGVTVVYAVGTAFGTVALATVLAAAVSARVWGSRVYRVLWFIPSIAPGAAVAVYWNTAFQPQDGTFNAILGYLGLGDNYAPLASASTAFYPLVFVTVWSGVGFAFILVLGAVENIPVSVYEAARVDGASAVRQFFSITLPLARPVLAITATLNLIWTFNNFSTVYGLTGGGPGTATTTLPLKVYLDAFHSGDYGHATAVAVLAGVLLIAMGFISLRLTRQRNEL